MSTPNDLAAALEGYATHDDRVVRDAGFQGSSRRATDLRAAAAELRRFAGGVAQAAKRTGLEARTLEAVALWGCDVAALNAAANAYQSGAAGATAVGSAEAAENASRAAAASAAVAYYRAAR